MRTTPLALLLALSIASCGRKETQARAPYAPGGAADVTAGAPTGDQDVFAVGGSISADVEDGEHFVTLILEATDRAGEPAAGLEIRGRFFGSFKKELVVTTEADGTALVKTPGGTGHLTMGFEILGVTRVLDGKRVAGSFKSELIAAKPCCQPKPTPTE